MRLSLPRRTFWVLLLFWLGPSIVVPELLDHCPVHHFSTVVPVGHAAMMHGGKQAPLHSSHRGCTCLDQGCAASTVAPPMAGIRIASTIRLVDTHVAFPDDIAYAVSSADYLFPPTTGPPPRV